MALTVEQFTQRLTSSGVMSDEQLRESLASLAPNAASPVDGEQLARELVKQKRLTKFQAEQLYAGKGNSLTLGNYVILDKLGQGGMGMVLKAQHKRMARVAALKVMSPAAVKSADAVKRFHREVQTAAKLTHPNIVTAFDADEAKGTHFLVMEYVEGDDLSQLVKKHGALSVEQTIECVIQTARGLAHAHAEGVIHRDIKPANLLLDKHGTVKILDMGLARLESGLSDAAGVEGAGLTQSGTIMGTVDYMSPEQAEDTRHADARADIYSLGCSLFYLLTGRAVYGGETMMKKLLAHRDAPIPSIADALANGGRQPPGSSSFDNGNHDTRAPGGLRPPFAGLQSIFNRMIAKRTSDRYQSMGEVIADLERCRAGQSVTVNVNAVSDEAGSSNELQRFLRQISGQDGSQITSAAGTIGTGTTPVDATAQTVFTTNNSAGTDPQTEMTLAGGRSVAGRFVAELVRVRSLGAAVRILTNSATGRLLAIVGAVVLLLGGWWMFGTPRGTVQIEIADEQIAVTLGETGRTLRGKRTETVKLPVGEHVLHVRIGETTLDTPEVEVVKGKLVEIKVEKVGNRVRVMRGKEFLVAKELPRSKVSGAKNTTNVGTSSDAAQNYALQFDGKASYVEVPTLDRDKPEPLTIEVWLRGAKSMTPFVRIEGRAPAQLHGATMWFLGAESDSAKGGFRQVEARTKLSPDSMVHAAYVIDDRAAKLFLNGVLVDTVPGPFPSPFSQAAFRGTWLGTQPLKQNAIAPPFAGVMDEVRISKVARYDKAFTPDVRFTSDKDTLALYHFDEGTGSELKDSSGNNHHGKIVGAKWVKVDLKSEISNLKSQISNPRSPYDILTSSDYEWSQPENLGSAINTPGTDGSPAISGDGLTLVFNSARAGLGNYDLFIAERKTRDEPFGLVQNLGPSVNSAENDNSAWLSSDGLTLIFSSDRTGPGKQYDLFLVTRPSRDAAFGKAEPLAELNTKLHESGGGLSGDARSIVFGSNRNGGSGPDLWQATRADRAASFGAPTPLGAPVESPGNESFGSLSADDRILFFNRRSKDSSVNDSDIWLAVRTSATAPFANPVLVGPPISLPNTPDVQASTTSDGKLMFFGSQRPGGLGGFDLWQSRRVLTPAAAARTQNAINLLPLIDPAKDSVHGGWSFNPAGELIVGEGTPARIRIPFRPAAEYDLHIEFTRHSGNGGNSQVLVAGGHQFLFALGLQQNKFAQFLLFDGQFAGTVQKEAWLVNGQRHRSLVQIRQGSVKTLFDGVPASELTTNYSTAAMPKDWELGDPAILGIGSVNSPTTFHRIEIVEITGHGTFTRPGDAAAKAAESKRAATSDTFTNSLGMEFVRVPKGKSWLGGGGGKPGTQEVTIPDDFYLGKYEVTQEEWEKVMGTAAGSFSRPGYNRKFVKDISDADLKRFPVEWISWDDAQGFVKRINESSKEAGWVYRLPTEQEWEFACRGGPMADQSESAFDFYLEKATNQLLPTQANIGKEINRTAMVGSYVPNRLGLCDMHGNVWEWCDDLQTYKDGAMHRVTRGGCWNLDPGHERAANRLTKPPSDRYDSLGLRLARVPVVSQAKFTNSLGMEFVRVPKGKSWLGGGGGKPGTQEVTISEDFYLGKFEVTQDEWEVVMDGSKPSYFLRGAGGGDSVKDLSDAERKRLPVEAVSWEHSQEFLLRLNEKAKDSGWQYRLPTATEWEYAARGGPMTKPEESAFHFYFDQPTNTLAPDQANVKESEPRRTRSVGSYLPNRLGLHDMHGNVREWCDDTQTSTDGSLLRLTRFGGWSTSAADCRAGRYGGHLPSTKEFDLGLRVARVPIAGQWQPLFNGKDLTGWTQANPKDTGKADVLVEDGQPILRLSQRLGLQSAAKAGDFHLRFDYKVEPGAAGRVNVFTTTGVGVQAILHSLTRPTPTLVIRLVGVTCQEAELRGGRFVPVGKTVGKDALIDFTQLRLDPNSPWQRIEVIRLGDSLLCLVNSHVAGAVTNLRDAHEAQERALGYSPLSFWSDSDSTTKFRNIELREINALPSEVVELAAWQPLFNGKDLTGWDRRDSGKAEIAMEVGQPTLRLTEPVTLSHPPIGDYHLRFEYQPSPGQHGGGLHLIGQSNRLSLGLGDLKRANVMGNGVTFQVAKIDAGKVVAVGQPVADKTLFPLANVSLNPASPWQRVEVVRQGDSFAVLISGKLAGAFTNVRFLLDGKPVLPQPRENLTIWAFGGPGHFRNIEIRKITSLPEIKP